MEKDNGWIETADYLDRRFGRWAGHLFAGGLYALIAGASLFAIYSFTVGPMLVNYRECGTVLLCANRH